MSDEGSALYDAAVAVSLDDHIMRGYEFLMNHYQLGDKIFLFGFSRGAYTARALAGMLETVQLLPPGNADLIPLAFTQYKAHLQAEKQYRALIYSTNWEDHEAWVDKVLHSIVRLPFSRKVEISFIGVWDTVSSVGGLVRRTLPFVRNPDFIRYFCHALALDENRVDYLTELVRPDECRPENTKQVWFVGSHSDVGGQRKDEYHESLADPALRWMIKEALGRGLALDWDILAGPWSFSRVIWALRDELSRNRELQYFLDHEMRAAPVWRASLPRNIDGGGNKPRNDELALKTSTPHELLMPLFWHARRLVSGLHFESPLSPHLSLPGTRQLPSLPKPFFHSSVKKRMRFEFFRGEPNGRYCPAATINGQKITLKKVDDLVEWVY
ncbi:hypothetical protein JCM8547_006716 [Rhodosporidiobolus lusitaniae]